MRKGKINIGENVSLQKFAHSQIRQIVFTAIS